MQDKTRNLQKTKKFSQYYWLIFLGFWAHTAYQLVFIYFGLKDLYAYNFVSMLVFGCALLYLRRDGRREDIAVLFCFIEATIFSTVSTLVAGWSWNFQDWMIAFSVFALMVPWETRRYFYALSVCNMVIYALLFIKIQLELPPYDLQIGHAFFSVANIVGIFVFLFFTAKVFGWSSMAELTLLRGEVLKMENAMRTDHLTGLMSRGYMDSILADISREWAAHERDFYVIFVDVDNFKRINDTYGHDVGDEALILVARTLRTELPLDASVARWGGEEFVILMTHHSENHCEGHDYVLQQLENARQKVQDLDFIHAGEKIPLTITVGGVNSVGYSNVRDMIVQADVQMYAGKKSGKNRVMLSIQK